MADPKRGFEITSDPAQCLLKICIWGVWDDEMGAAYARTFREQTAQIPVNAGTWQMLLDLTGYLFQPKAIEKLIGQTLMSLSNYTIRKRAVISRGPIVHFPTGDTIPEQGFPIYSYFWSEEDALRWLMESNS